MRIAKSLGAVLGYALTFAASASAQITIAPPPPLPFGTIGGTYLVTFVASGGPSGNYNYTISAGTLPPGLLLTTFAGNNGPTTGRLTGFPTTGGTFNFTVRATDGIATGLQTYSIGIMQVVTASPLPGANVGTPYSLQFTATDAPLPHQWSAPGAPAGFAMSPGGLLTGTPGQTGTFTFNVQAISVNNATATKAVTITVFPALQIVTGAVLAPSYVGSPITVNLAATGGRTPPPYVWSLQSGSTLPDGLTLSTNGILSGTPKVPSPASGPFTFRIQVRDANNGVDSKLFSIIIYDTLSFATPNPLPSGTKDIQYTLTFQGAGGLGPYTYGIVPSGLGSGVPTGMQLNSAGVLSGVPVVASSFSFIVRITDANGVNTQATFNINITLLNITTASPLPPGQVGAAYNQTLLTTGGIAPYTYVLTFGALPAGLSLSPAGVLAGTLGAAGTFNFTITSTDAQQQAVTKQFQLVIGVQGTVLRVQPGSLSYAAKAGSDSPPPQYLQVTGVNSAAINFSVTIDNGSGGAAPPWISVFPLTGTTPARLTVLTDPLNLAGGTSYPARIRIQVQGSTPGANAPPIDIPITNTVTTAPSDVIAYPTYLRFEFRIGLAKIKELALNVINRGGGGSQSFQMSVVKQSPWLSLTPPNGTTDHNKNAIVLVKANSQGLAPGLYRDSIRFTSASNSYEIPVSVYVAPAGALLKLSTNGIQFQVKQGAGGANAQVVKVLNVGEPNSTINWQATILQGNAWFSISPSAGTSSPGAPGILTVVPGAGAQNLPAAGAYAVLRITDSNGNNTPQYLTALLDVLDANTPSAPDLSPGSLVFRVVPGAATQTQQLLVYTSDLTGAPFQASANTFDGGSWLSVSPGTGTTSTRAPGQLTVLVNPANLKNGVYRGEISVSMAGGVRITSVTLIIADTPPSSGTKRESTAVSQRNADCSPTQLVVNNLNTAGEFFIKAGWPIFLLVQVYDDCNSAVTGANVVAAFSNGDLPLTLFPDPDTNLYTGVWQPGSVSASATVAFAANLGDLGSGDAGTGNAANLERSAGANVVVGNGSVSGTVTANPSPAPPPFLNACGVVNNTNVTPCAGIAPGTVSSVYGLNLAPSPPVSPGVLPLPTTFAGTSVLVGGQLAPMFYLSPNQINIQLPTELIPGRQYQVLVTSPGGVSATDVITVVPVSPGISAAADGQLTAQHGNGSLVTPQNPARPGETLAMYLTGMGGTNPLVATGAQAPGVVPLPVLQNAPTVTIDGQGAGVVFSGLTPGGIGLYQINFTVPTGARTGELDVVVTQLGVASNTTRLTVQR